MYSLTKELDKDIVYATEMRDYHRSRATLATDGGKRQANHLSKARFFSGMRRGLMVAKERV